MRARPLLFSTLMVQALLAGRKTITRRVVKNPLDVDFLNTMEHASRKDILPDLLNRIATDVNPFTKELQFPCPHGIIGDLIWVRETWTGKPGDWIEYKADSVDGKPPGCWPWRPSIHMPKQIARIWLEISNIRIERLQDITDEDAIAEGIEESTIDMGKFKFYDPMYKDYDNPKNVCYVFPTGSFFSLWDSINGRDSHEQNPWVWVIEFKVLSTTGKPVAADQEGVAV